MRTRSAEKPKLTTKRRATAPKPKAQRRLLLVLDGDSFAHLAYHALPKSILRRGDRPAGAILGFANFLLRFHEAGAFFIEEASLGTASRDAWPMSLRRPRNVVSVAKTATLVVLVSVTLLLAAGATWRGRYRG